MGLVATDYGIKEALRQLGVGEVNNGSSTGSEFFANGGSIASYSPVDGKLIAKVNTTSPEDFERVMSTATDAFKHWRTIPAPQRGEVVRQFLDFQYPFFSLKF